ncbi:transposase [Streptomyces sp. NPDC087298]|uniref:transposase n=1 Tax=Streptomyces sp. NPDC087298 TaxID=3365779 RepID=UPI003818E610
MSGWRRQYLCNLWDEQWSLIESVITAWKNQHRSVKDYPGKYARREIANAILYQSETGCRWTTPARPAAEARDVLPPRSVLGRWGRPGQP